MIEDLKLEPFLCYVQFDGDFEDFDFDYSEDFESKKIEAMRCRVLDGPFVGKTATIKIEE